MKTLLLAFSISCFYTSHSQAIHTKKLDSLFDILQNHGLANGNIAISVNGKTAYQRAVGFAVSDSAAKKEANVNTKYRVGSVSKMFTATMIFQLVEEKKLSLDDKLATYFPLLPNANKITIRTLLYHRSGLHDYTHDTDFQGWMDKPITHQELLTIITNKGADFEPGARAEYSNSNYLVLSYIIEKVCKMPYELALEKRIVTRIKLKNTHYGKPVNMYGNEAVSYKYADHHWKKEKPTHPSLHSGAGSIVSTSGDLAVFIQSLFTGKLVSRASLDSMKTMIDGYGMGLFPYNSDLSEGFGHNGRIEEFYSSVRYYPGKQLAVSYITNGILYPRTDILDGILKICFNKEYTIPFSRAVALQNIDFQKYAGIYSSTSLPFKVECKMHNGKLVFEAAGKTMEAEMINIHYFMNLQTGSFFEFNPGIGELHIKETDNVYFLQKEK